jgi:hypothetical protein
MARRCVGASRGEGQQQTGGVFVGGDGFGLAARWLFSRPVK